MIVVLLKSSIGFVEKFVGHLFPTFPYAIAFGIEVSAPLFEKTAH